ncbi:MAG: RraA family protein [Pseudomonadota bacterium]
MSITNDQLTALLQFDTPTICNALEVMAPERRGHGFNRQQLMCPTAVKGPAIGYARTATIRSRERQNLSADELRARRIEYYRYVDEGPRPSMMVLQDTDPTDRGVGSFWGEVQSNLHLSMGCHGVVTDGSIRDIDDWADGFLALSGSVMPSHVWAEIVSIDISVNVAGMVVDPADIIHADQHGAVVIPPETVAEIPKIAKQIAEREAILIRAAKAGPMGVKDIEEALSKASELH